MLKFCTAIVCDLFFYYACEHISSPGKQEGRGGGRPEASQQYYTLAKLKLAKWQQHTINEKTLAEEGVRLW